MIEDFTMCGSIESRANCSIDRVLIDSRPAAFNASSFVKDSEYYRADFKDRDSFTIHENYYTLLL